MRVQSVCASVALLIGLMPDSGTRADGPTGSQAAVAEIRQGNKDMVGRRYAEAIEAYRRGAVIAAREGDIESAIRCDNNAGAAALMMMRYASAATAFQSALDRARRAGNRTAETAAQLNLASAYIWLGEGDAATEALNAAESVIPAGSRYRLQLKALQARLALRQGPAAEAYELLAEAMDECRRRRAYATEALLWNDLALVRLGQGDLGGSEEAVANEYRLRSLFRLGHLEDSFTVLGRLRLAQGRPLDALAAFQSAGRLRKVNVGQSNLWVNEFDRATALGAAGRGDESFSALRGAWKLALAWRAEMLPAQLPELSADVSLSALATAIADAAGAAQGRETGRVWDAFVAVEQGRAASLTRLIYARQSVRDRLGPEYLAALSTWRAEVASGLATEARPLTAVHAKLAQMEGMAGVEPLPGPQFTQGRSSVLVKNLQGKLKPEQALFSFRMSEPRSHLWVLTHTTSTYLPLPGRRVLGDRLARFREAVMTGGTGLGEHSAALYETVFGGIPKAASDASEWLLSLDETLHSSPLAALRTGREDSAPYLAEVRTLRSLPSALALLQGEGRNRGSGLVAVGGAIHNLADGRLAESETRRFALPLSFWTWPFAARPAPQPTFQLASLPGSLREVTSVARAWSEDGRGVRLITGAAASEMNVEEALSKGPEVVHFATHVVPVKGPGASVAVHHRVDVLAGTKVQATPRPDDVFIALSLDQSGRRHGINTGVVSGISLPGSLVVLNGCSSGLGTVQPGAGLLGFTRAWLAAGAQSVMASLWPVPDDDGVMFKVFYQRYGDGADAAKALKAAQTAMIASRTWRSHPRYWSAYFLVGKE
ncbi:MAG: CHAT domain-containing protein [Acidobacteria bacterium]|nr:CHAT domain-containing protein [Acidobacteriota bacterium]